MVANLVDKKALGNNEKVLGNNALSND